MVTITEPLVRKLLATVDAGLVKGVGVREPGKMCVEAAISFALGEPHSDGPSCVDPNVRQAKIILNDSAWSSEQARARGMRRVAIAQLGSKDTIDSTKFVRLLAEYTIREVVPVALRAAALLNPSQSQVLEDRAVQCERDGDKAAADAARAAAYAARAAADAAMAAADAAMAERDRILSLCATLMVRALQECASPGCDWLWLVDETEVKALEVGK